MNDDRNDPRKYRNPCGCDSRDCGADHNTVECIAKQDAEHAAQTHNAAPVGDDGEKNGPIL